MSSVTEMGDINRQEVGEEELEDEIYTDTDSEDEDMTDIEEEYMGKVDELISIIERLEELKSQGEQGDIEEKIEEVRAKLNEYLDQPINF